MNRNTKSLSLRKETLVELSSTELDHAAGGYIVNNTVFKPNDTSFGRSARIHDTVDWKDPGFAPHNLPRFPQPREFPQWPRNVPVYTIGRRQPTIVF